LAGPSRPIESTPEAAAEGGASDNFQYPQDPEFVPYLDAAIDAVLAGKTPPRAETPSFGCPIESVYYTLPEP